jgi:uncharacterized protein (DUF1697 family)
MTQIALLRAVNVGGKGVVRMTDVRAAFEASGCRSVRTFLASGNVVFEAPAPRGARAAAMKTRVREALCALLGNEPGLCYRTLPQLEAVIAANPFGPLTSDATVKLYVVFMDRRPPHVPPLPLSFPKEAIDIIGVRATEAFVVSRRKPAGMMYGFPNACVESLGVVATSRNWNTVTRLAEFARC